MVASVDYGIPCLAILGRTEGSGAAKVRTVRFGNAATIPRPFRDRTFLERGSRDGAGSVPAPGPGDVVLAEQDGRPAWVQHRAGSGPGSLESAWVPLPLIAKDDLLINFLDRNRFIGLLPLMAFLQRVSANRAWVSRPLRACIVIDDPNLRRPSYGCLDFHALADHAHKHQYHAAIATVPIDARNAAPDVAAIMRERAAQLSLVIHGNNHLPLELAIRRRDYAPTAVLAQALRRMDDLARRYDLDIRPIMEPPYGAISSDYFAALVALGYEATLLTTGHFNRWNRVGIHTSLLGLAPGECLAGGLAVISRIMAAPGWETEVAVAAFLGQPIVIVGHHFDAAGKLEFLAEVADVVNGMGPVTWSDLSAIARSRFVTRREGSTLRVRAASRRIVVPVPADVGSIVIERPWIAAGGSEPLHWGAPGAPVTVAPTAPAESTPIRVDHGGPLEIVSPAPARLDPASVPPPRAMFWPFVRRACTEARDRCYPVFLAHATGLAAATSG